MRTRVTLGGGVCAALLFIVLIFNCSPATESDPSVDADGMEAAPDSTEPSSPSSPLVGESGDPVSGLSDDEATLFETGEALFERVFTIVEGLGPSEIHIGCVLCHDQPVTGGAGGIKRFRFTGAGPFGTDEVTQRNAPSLFGMGLLERISDEEILSRQDLFDADGDGISGEANVEVDRVGRFGRKAQAATIESMVRGMLVNQMGITTDALPEPSAHTVPERPGFFERILEALASVSFATPAYAQAAPPAPDEEEDDGDGVADPELDSDSLRSLMAYVANLAAPVRGEIDAAVERGEAVFESTGCTACHVPTLPTTDGLTLHVYSDLLLHDMGDELADGILRGRASGTEFRTQPLWGLRNVAPYLHDGRAATLEQAIVAHGGEAEPSRQAYELLDESARQDLLRFLESL